MLMRGDFDGPAAARADRIASSTDRERIWISRSSMGGLATVIMRAAVSLKSL